MGILKYVVGTEWYKKFVPKEGLKAIANYLANNEGKKLVLHLNQLHTLEFELLELRGSGKYIKGYGSNRVYDIEFRSLKPDCGVVTGWMKLSPSNTPRYCDLVNIWFKEYWADRGLDTYAFSKDMEDRVWNKLKEIAARLKPYQNYNLGKHSITSDIGTPDSVKVRVTASGNLTRVPIAFIAFWAKRENSFLEREFNILNIGVDDEEKIDRQHRPLHDLKHWITITKVEKVSDRHNFVLTPRQSLVDKTTYFAVDLLLDSPTLQGKPIYLSEFLRCAKKQLEKTYPNNDWKYSWDLDATHVTNYREDTVTLPDYMSKQKRYPDRKDSTPIILEGSYIDIHCP